MFTLKGITTLARFGLPLILLADFMVATPSFEGTWPGSVHFGVAYLTSVMMLLAFHRRPAIELAVGVAVILILVWAVNTIGNDIHRLIAALAGVLCGLIPAYLRDFQINARSEEHMDLDEIRNLRRRRSDARADDPRPHPAFPIRLRKTVTLLPDRWADRDISGQ